MTITPRLRNEIALALPGVRTIKSGEAPNTIAIETASVDGDEMAELMAIEGTKLNGIYSIGYRVVIVLNVEHAETPLFDPAALTTSAA